MQNDEIDIKLLRLLTENARRSVTSMAQTLGVARTTVQARIERLENNGAITGYTLRRSQSARPALQATVLISIEPRSGPAVLARLRTLSNVEQVNTTSGRWDLIARLSAPTTETLDQTLDDIGAAKGVRSSESLIHLSTKIDRS
ncbi:Lrp/AsnC family transcriptional regulator [uncultured Lentibacter sp.]|uniref:Lrp/AsnC family transcriptional regulator n=1 Tax=uncultured Lentibacter sp. TaxID=1659309 RepID=UPI0026043DC8|nr:Lrp/AsnC family transcriptional regulator [uncultured Lentibacter sp.]